MTKGVSVGDAESCVWQTRLGPGTKWGRGSSRKAAASLLVPLLAKARTLDADSNGRLGSAGGDMAAGKRRD